MGIRLSPEPSPKSEEDKYVWRPLVVFISIILILHGVLHLHLTGNQQYFNDLEKSKCVLRGEHDYSLVRMTIFEKGVNGKPRKVEDCLCGHERVVDQENLNTDISKLK